jgi:hypothetical protein
MKFINKRNNEEKEPLKKNQEELTINESFSRKKPLVKPKTSRFGLLFSFLLLIFISLFLFFISLKKPKELKLKKNEVTFFVFFFLELEQSPKLFCKILVNSYDIYGLKQKLSFSPKHIKNYRDDFALKNVQKFFCQQVLNLYQNLKTY